MRALSDQFFNALNQTQGVLHPIMQRVRQDHTLMLAIRDGYINIYYRGGNILRIQERGSDFQTFFDENYNKIGLLIPDCPTFIASQDDSEIWVNSFLQRKYILDVFLAEKGKTEREFQQLVARENNYSTISNESEYFISDIEFSDSGNSARFDLLALRWLAGERKKGNTCRAAFVEMKYGDNALDGSAGLLKHLMDIDEFIADEIRYGELLAVMEKQFNQLYSLGLMKFNQNSSGSVISINGNEKPEVIFILANHNPRSIKLKNILNTPDIKTYSQSDRFDLRFFVASFAGYGMHSKCMLTLEEFQRILLD